MESRSRDPDNFLMETSLRLLLIPSSPLEGLKGRLFCVTNLSPVYAQVTRPGGSWGMRMDVSPMEWPCQTCRAWQPLLSWCLDPPCPSRVPLPLGPSPITQFWVSLNPKCHHHCRAQRTHPKLQLSTMEGMFPGRLGCPPPKATAGIWFQEWTAPGWEHDLVGESVWAPGLMLLSHSLSSVWGSLLRDWNFAHDCGVLDASIDTNHSERKDN